MSQAYSHAHAGGYERRSLLHERRMLEVYRERAARNPGLLQPLANACWRAASFEWALHEDAAAVMRLWGEGARALAGGWTRRHSSFDPNPDHFVLALHLAIGARDLAAFTALAAVEPTLRPAPTRDPRLVRGAHALVAHARAYGLVARAIVTHDLAHVRRAIELLDAAYDEGDSSWWQDSYPEPHEAVWRHRQHGAECRLLLTIARHVNAGNAADANGEEQAETFARILDDALAHLQTFVEQDADHNPKLYVWLPGVALSRLAASSGLSLDPTHARRDADPVRYCPLPPAFLPAT